MKKLNSILVGILAVLAAPVALSQSLNCATLSNSAGTEPAGYGQQCAFTPSPNMIAPAPSAPTDTAFVYNIRTAAGSTPGLFRHALNNMPGMTMVGPPLTVFGMDFNPSNSLLYVVDSTTAATPLLRTVDQTTGVATTIAPITVDAGEGVTDLVIHPQTGVAWLSTFTAAPVGSRLFTINLTTGVRTLVGTMSTTNIFIDLAVNCAGQMFAHDITTDALFSVNPATAASTSIGTHGLAANFAQGMDFDNQDGQLYAWVYTGVGTYTFGTFNLATGAITPVNTNTPPGEWEGAIRNTCAPVGGADLALTQSNNAPAVLAIGTTFQKTLTTTNNGPSTATGITVTDTLPAQLTFVSSNCGATATGQVVTYTIATLAPAAVNNCAITVTVNSSGTITNTAAITASSPADPTPANNTTTAQIGPAGGAPPATADLALTQSNNAAGNALLIGSTFQKTLTVTNNGPGAATAITVTDTLPAQLAFVSSTCGATATGQVVTYTIPTLANGAVNNCVLTVRVQSTGTIVNTAAITASTPTDPAAANNTTTAQIGPTGGGLAQTAVPALDLKSILVLLGLVSALGMLALRQRQA